MNVWGYFVLCLSNVRATIAINKMVYCFICSVAQSTKRWYQKLKSFVAYHICCNCLFLGYQKDTLNFRGQPWKLQPWPLPHIINMSSSLFTKLAMKSFLLPIIIVQWDYTSLIFRLYSQNWTISLHEPPVTMALMISPGTTQQNIHQTLQNDLIMIRPAPIMPA